MKSYNSARVNHTATAYS